MFILKWELHPSPFEGFVAPRGEKTTGTRERTLGLWRLRCPRQLLIDTRPTKAVGQSVGTLSVRNWSVFPKLKVIDEVNILFLPRCFHLLWSSADMSVASPFPSIVCRLHDFLLIHTRPTKLWAKVLTLYLRGDWSVFAELKVIALLRWSQYPVSATLFLFFCDLRLTCRWRHNFHRLSVVCTIIDLHFSQPRTKLFLKALVHMTKLLSQSSLFFKSAEFLEWRVLDLSYMQPVMAISRQIYMFEIRLGCCRSIQLLCSILCDEFSVHIPICCVAGHSVSKFIRSHACVHRRCNSTSTRARM